MVLRCCASRAALWRFSSPLGSSVLGLEFASSLGIASRSDYHSYFRAAGSFRALSSFSGERHITSLSELRSSEIVDRTHELASNVLKPINKTYMGPLPRSATDSNDYVDRPSMPLVFLLGNHSSGKSTFVNYLQGRNIQTTGVAPTDDAFTIITSGAADSDHDGPALVGNPSSGFGGLRTFGPNLINHVNLKVRSGLEMDGIMVVDSPGMIDSPAGSSNPWDFAASSQDRGYDFQGVTRWFAERADVICLFFDPDKPGTTGETLATLTTSLTGLDHKLLIILNKVDQFDRIHDFARSYGSLCWNLSKVIPRKDLPRIYTMCIPGHASANDRSLVEVLDDLDLQREEVISEVKRAPERRMDNLITNLYDSTRLLRTHVVVADAARRAHQRVVWKYRLSSGGLFASGSIVAALLAQTGALLEVGLGVWCFSLVATALSIWQGRSSIKASEDLVISKDGLDSFFKETHMLNLAEGDEFLASLWEQRVCKQLQLALKTIGPDNIPALSNSDLNELDRILKEETASLRKLSDPLHA